MKISITAIVTVMVLWMPVSAPAAGKVSVDRMFKSISVIGLRLPSPNPFDVDLLPPQIAVDNIVTALDYIYENSAFNRDKIEKLKANGMIRIIYDARFPRPDMASQIIAAYFPDYYQHKGKRREFRVVVGRFGAKWETGKLAAVLIHELVGHGLQHFRGRTFMDRKIDRECEALIYEERAYQDFKIKRDTNHMVRFRRDMRRKWCSDFSRFLTAKGINTDEAWGYGTPDVPKLLTHFDAYANHLRKTGVSGKAVRAEKREILQVRQRLNLMKKQSEN